MGTLPNTPRNTFASWGSNTLPLQLGDSWNVEALRKDTPCRSEGTLAKNALQPVEMWSCQGSRCCTLCLPLQRCESKVVLVGRCRNICTYDICTQKKNIITQPVEQFSTFFPGHFGFMTIPTQPSPNCWPVLLTTSSSYRSVQNIHDIYHMHTLPSNKNDRTAKPQLEDSSIKRPTLQSLQDD